MKKEKALLSRASSWRSIKCYCTKTYLTLLAVQLILAGSNKTMIKGAADFIPGEYEGRNIWFGVREFAMGAALNGMAFMVE